MIEITQKQKIVVGCDREKVAFGRIKRSDFRLTIKFLIPVGRFTL